MVELIELKVSERKKAEELAELADKIWTEHYSPIIGKAQVKYMIDKFQSANKILEDISKNGYRYFIAYDGAKPAGYCAIKSEHEKHGLFLSKLYVVKESRGCGISRMMLNKMLSIANEERLDHMWLTVNKHNSNSINIYKKLGFRIVEALVTDIGNGFVMDDYKMRIDFKL